MKTTSILLIAAAMLSLAACERHAPPPVAEAALPMPAARPPADLVDELARDPERLKAARKECRENRADRDEELCVASALALRQHVLGKHKTSTKPVEE